MHDASAKDQGNSRTMANREELAIIKGARGGRATSQLELGKLYLFGSAGLPKSMPTALHWLDRAAQQDLAEAWFLIGTNIPFDVAYQSGQPIARWYERAFDDGVVQAGLVLAQLVLAGGDDGSTAELRAKAMRSLEAAAEEGLPDAQWLLAQHSVAAADGKSGLGASQKGRPGMTRRHAEPEWLARAADSGVAQAQMVVLERAWEEQDWAGFLQRALPLARAVALAAPAVSETAKAVNGHLSPDEVQLLARCAQLLVGGLVTHGVAAAETQRFWELAAQESDRSAQMALGLWHARMVADGTRAEGGPVSANFKRAIRWLTMAGEQGLAEAWYALSRIYLKPEFSQRSVAEAQIFLERAAEMGHAWAQLECGSNAWRARRDHLDNDVRAAYWLQKAAAQGSAEALKVLGKVAPQVETPEWASTMASLQLRDLMGSHPFMAGRIELAAMFRLSRAEALLLDVCAADHGHCLVVDISASYGRSKRRLVLLHTAQERKALDRIVKLFEDVDCGSAGPEGNYRQRLYRFKTLLPGGQLELDQHEIAP